MSALLNRKGPDSSLKEAGVRVPGGFALASDAYRQHLEENAIGAEILAALDALDVEDVRALAETGRTLRK